MQRPCNVYTGARRERRASAGRRAKALAGGPTAR
jgi:hypothetical protein